MRYRFDPQLKQEKALAAQIHDALEGDVIDQVMEYTGAMEFDDSAIHAIADKALERKTGARGLRSIMEKAMMDVMYRIPSEDNIAECIITKEAVTGEGQPTLIFRDGSLKAQ